MAGITFSSQPPSNPAPDGLYYCENLQCPLAVSESDHPPIEPPRMQIDVSWTFSGEVYHRRVFLCCECRPVALNPAGFSVTVV